MSLFHYTKLDTFLDYIIPSGSLMANNLANMNDPRESYNWTFGSVNLPMDKLFPDDYSDNTHIDCQYKFGQMVKDRFQVICFSGAKHNGWDNEMMWAHYADRQRGICLEFDEVKLFSAIRDHFPEIRFELQAINYIRNRKQKPWISWNGQISDEDNLKNFLEILCREVTFNKSHFWEKEDEMRLLFLNHPDRLFIPFEESLKAIHIGLGIPKPQHEGIFNALRGKNIELYVMIYENDQYQRWKLTKTNAGWYTSINEEDLSPQKLI